LATSAPSPGNFQAWLAIPGCEDKEFARRVRKGTGADPGASGATRIAGSLNFKPKYAPDYPRVAIRTAQPGQTVTAAELEQLGLVAPKEQFTAIAPARFEAAHLRIWPDWQMAVDSAPLNRAGTGPDLSIGDFRWCMLSSTWGFDEKDIIEKLLEVSEHTRRSENGRSYADKTAKKAIAWVEQRRQ
jgi:RepB DNA-primase from phage plasmid